MHIHTLGWNILKFPVDCVCVRTAFIELRESTPITQFADKGNRITKGKQDMFEGERERERS